MTNVEFEQNIKKIISKDKTGLQEIYIEYKSTIYIIIYQVVKSKENAEDITSDFFIKLWNNAYKYNFKLKHKKWLGKMAYNMAIDFIRKHNRIEFVQDFTCKQIGTVSIENDICQKLSFEEQVNSLAEDEKLILNLKLICEFTYKDISELLKLPLGTVAWKYQQAIKQLRRTSYEKDKKELIKM